MVYATHFSDLDRVPTRIGKPEKWEGIFQSEKNQGILNRLEKSGRIPQITGKVGISEKYYLLFLVIFK